MGDDPYHHLFPAPGSNRMVDALREVAENEEIIQTVADKLERWSEPFGIRALASNIPGVSSTDEARREAAVDALWAVCRIAERLDIPCVEAVGGGDFGRWGSDDRWIIEASWTSYEERGNALLKSLQTLCERMSGCGMDKVAIALELEPGPSYLLNSIRGRPFCHRDKPSTLERVLKDLPAQYVGLNLDVGHFLRLEAIEPDLLAHVYSDYLDRILHAHVSRHSGIHGQDLYLRDSDYAECKRWLKLFTDSADRERASESTRTVAIELEACHQVEWIEQSLHVVRKWLEDKMGYRVADPALDSTTHD